MSKVMYKSDGEMPKVTPVRGPWLLDRGPLNADLGPRNLALEPRTSAVDKAVDKLCALIVRDNLIKCRNSGSF